MRPEWWLAIAAPVIVTGGLVILHQVAIVILVYQLGLCLALPAWIARREGRSWREHRRDLALGGRGWRMGLVAGLVLAAVPVGAHTWLPALFPAASDLRATLATWGIAPDRVLPLLVAMGVTNGPAEELFWRGWLLTRLGTSGAAPWLLVLLFTSYHTVTIGALAPSSLAAGVMLVGVLLAAAFWTWTRQRWHASVPA
ncbi:CPBP family intramembrane metalloprotease, partial [bacterium]|nr:CPBP family intramembrane metalloprotease [bacterium]